MLLTWNRNFIRAYQGKRISLLLTRWWRHPQQWHLTLKANYRDAFSLKNGTIWLQSLCCKSGLFLWTPQDCDPQFFFFLFDLIWSDFFLYIIMIQPVVFKNNYNRCLVYSFFCGQSQDIVPRRFSFTPLSCCLFSGLKQIFSKKFLICGCFQALSRQFVGTRYPF